MTPLYAFSLPPKRRRTMPSCTTPSSPFVFILLASLLTLIPVGALGSAAPPSGSEGTSSPLEFQLEPVAFEGTFEELMRLGGSYPYNPSKGIAAYIRHIWETQDRADILVIAAREVSGDKSQSKKNAVAGGIFAHFLDERSVVIDGVFVHPEYELTELREKLLLTVCNLTEDLLASVGISSFGTVSFSVPTHDVKAIERLEEMGFKMETINYSGFPLSDNMGVANMVMHTPRRTLYVQLVKDLNDLKNEVKTLRQIRDKHFGDLSKRFPEIAEIPPREYSPDVLIDVHSPQTKAHPELLAKIQAIIYETGEPALPDLERADMWTVCATYDTVGDVITGVGWISTSESGGPFPSVFTRIGRDGFAYAKIMDHLLKKSKENGKQQMAKTVASSDIGMQTALRFLGFRRISCQEETLHDSDLESRGQYMMVKDLLSADLRLHSLAAACHRHALSLQGEKEHLLRTLAMFGELDGGHMSVDAVKQMLEGQQKAARREEEVTEDDITEFVNRANAQMYGEAERKLRGKTKYQLAVEEAESLRRQLEKAKERAKMWETAEQQLRAETIARNKMDHFRTKELSRQLEGMTEILRFYLQERENTESADVAELQNKVRALEKQLEATRQVLLDERKIHEDELKNQAQEFESALKSAVTVPFPMQGGDGVQQPAAYDENVTSSKHTNSAILPILLALGGGVLAFILAGKIQSRPRKKPQTLWDMEEESGDAEKDLSSIRREEERGPLSEAGLEDTDVSVVHQYFMSDR